MEDLGSRGFRAGPAQSKVVKIKFLVFSCWAHHNFEHQYALVPVGQAQTGFQSVKDSTMYQ